jgi:hypothetical protein
MDVLFYGFVVKATPAPVVVDVVVGLEYLVPKPEPDQG